MTWNLPEQPAEPSTELVPRPQIVDRYAGATGVVLDTQDAVEQYLRDMMRLRNQLNEEMDRCREWLRSELAARGTSSSGTVQIKRHTERRWNFERLQDLPEDIYSRIVEETVEQRVRWAEAKKVAASNPAYRKIIEEALEEERTFERVSLAR